MFSIIQDVHDINRNGFSYPDHNYVVNAFEGNIERLESVMSKKAPYLPNNNILVDLIYGLPLKEHLSDSDYYLHILYSLDNFLTAQKFADETHAPVFITDGIYNGIFELFISKPAKSLSTAKKVISIEHHPFNTPMLPIFGDVEANVVRRDALDYAVISVDIPLLAVKWRNYRKELIRKNGPDTGVSISGYVMNELFPLLYRDHANIAMANLLYKQLSGDANVFVVKPDEVTQITIGNKAADSYANILMDILGRDLNIGGILKTTPLTEGFVLEDVVTNLNTELDKGHYLELISNFSLLRFLLSIANIVGNTVDSSYINNLHKQLRYLKNNNGLRNSFTDFVAEELLKRQTDVLADLLR